MIANCGQRQTDKRTEGQTDLAENKSAMHQLASLVKNSVSATYEVCNTESTCLPGAAK